MLLANIVDERGSFYKLVDKILPRAVRAAMLRPWRLDTTRAKSGR